MTAREPPRVGTGGEDGAPIGRIPMGARSGRSQPVPVPPGPDRVSQVLAGGRRIGLSAPTVLRVAPNPNQIVRRQRLLRWSKLMLPVLALLLLGSLALWPEIERSLRFGRASLHEAASLKAATGLMTDVAYRGIDAHGRPYMITATAAQQVAADRVDLTEPKADIFSQGGAWLMLTADRGVYASKSQMLDLSGHVVLYRDDGTFLTAPTATIDLRQGVDASRDWVHVEGPFGVLDAGSYFMSSHDGVLQFHGPARLVLNEAEHRR